MKSFDFAVFKRTTFGERAGLEFRTEFFNLFNHPQFGFPGQNFNPTTDPSTSVVNKSANGFGKVTSQANNPPFDSVRIEICVLSGSSLSRKARRRELSWRFPLLFRVWR